jgi:O-antigen/teichoic acid export membrane protein
LGNWGINLLYGKEYLYSSKILLVHVCANIFIFIGNINGSWLIIRNLRVFYLVSLLAGLVANVILNYFLINSIGVIGAAYATLISCFIAYFFVYLFHSETRVIFKMQLRAILMVDLINKFFNKIPKKG